MTRSRQTWYIGAIYLSQVDEVAGLHGSETPGVEFLGPGEGEEPVGGVYAVDLLRDGEERAAAGSAEPVARSLDFEAVPSSPERASRKRAAGWTLQYDGALAAEPEVQHEPLGVEVLDVPSEDFLVEHDFAEAASVGSPSADGEGRADASSDEGLADGLGGQYT